MFTIVATFGVIFAHYHWNKRGFWNSGVRFAYLLLSLWGVVEVALELGYVISM